MTVKRRAAMKRSATEEPLSTKPTRKLVRSSRDATVGHNMNINRTSASVSLNDRTVLNIDAEPHDLDNEDDDDIPYTHQNTSRSQSPVFLGSDTLNDEGLPAANGKRNEAQPEIISLDDEDEEVKEYYVISDNEQDEEIAKLADDDEPSVTQKTTNQQLQENQHINNSKVSAAHCAVCFDCPEQTYVLPCGHLYCGDCVFKALSSTKQSTKNGGPCSLCRAYTPYKKVMLAIFKKKRKVLA